MNILKYKADKETFYNYIQNGFLKFQKITRLKKSVVTIFENAQDLKLIEPRFTLLVKTNKTKKVDKLTSNLLVKVKSVFYTEIP